MNSETDVNEVMKHARVDRERVTPQAYCPAGRSSRDGPGRRTDAGSLQGDRRGTIDDPVPSGVLRQVTSRRFTGEANFGFNFTCEMTAKNKAVIKGQITYHDTGTSTVDGARVSRRSGFTALLIPSSSPPPTARRRRRSSWMRPSSTAPTGPRTRL